MSKCKWILGIILATTALSAQAEICKQTNMGFKFRQVVLGLEGGLRCDYGPEFDFKHSYELDGKFHPGHGAWMGASDPYTVYCVASEARYCSFYAVKKR